MRRCSSFCVGLLGAFSAWTWIGSDLRAAESITLPPVVDSFETTAAALASSYSEKIKLERAQIRLMIIRKAFTQRLIAAKATDSIVLGDFLEEADLLCGPRETHIANTARYNYISGVVSGI